MTWILDTCDCILKFSSGGNNENDFMGFIKRCKLHQILFGGALKDAVFLHNRSFKINLSDPQMRRSNAINRKVNDDLPLNPSEQIIIDAINKNQNDKRDEVLRIRNL